MAEERKFAAQAAEIIDRHVKRRLDRFLALGDIGYPLVTQNGRWLRNPVDRWSDGFWPGIFWRAWQATGEQRFRDQAARQSVLVVPRIENPDRNYDLGFLFFYSHALGFSLTGEARYRDVALRAAYALSRLAAPEAGCIVTRYEDRIQSFGTVRVTTKIDVMMNLTLIWWAYAETGNRHFLELATRHATRSLECLLRDDGSAWELADFNPNNGELLVCDTKEGVDGPSCWARGQAWAIYGFLQAARFTGEHRFCVAAERALSFWLRHVPEDGIPFWDLLAPEPQRNVRDTSAAAIVLAALVQAQFWCMPLGSLDDVAKLLTSLEAFLAPPGHDGLLSAGCGYYRKGFGIDEATVWGDYYFLEALALLSPATSA